MSQDEIKAAIAEQEEHLKRSEPCMGERGVSHAFRPFAKQVSKSPPRKVAWSACVVCRVTETQRDYEIKNTKGLAT